MQRIQMRVIAAALFLGTPALAAPHPQPLSDPHGHWKLLPRYSDEFNGTSLDTTKYTADIKSWGNWSWDRKNVSVGGGSLKITMRYAPHQEQGQKKFYTSGIVESVAPPLLHGYFEARLKGASRFPGVCPAFWLNNTTPNLWTEIDIAELQEEAWAQQVDHFTHVWRYPGIDEPIVNNTPSYLDANPWETYHTYGVKWDAKTLRFYVDGKLVGTQPATYFTQPLKVVLSMGLRKPLHDEPNASGFPTQMSVDYLRVWTAQ